MGIIPTSVSIIWNEDHFIKKKKIFEKG